LHDLSPGKGGKMRGEKRERRGDKGEGRGGEGRKCWRAQMRWKAIR